VLTVIEVATLIGLGETWENSIRQHFGREAESCQIPDQPQQVQIRQLVQQLNRWAQDVQATDITNAATLKLAESLGWDICILKTPEHKYLCLREGEQSRGWGQILWRVPTPNSPQTDSPNDNRSRLPWKIIEVPHPVFDSHTPELGLRIFERYQADVFLLAGSHRLNRIRPSQDQPQRAIADPAHSRQTAFHSMHHGLVDNDLRTLQIIQIHGFKSRSSLDPDAVISDGLDDGYWSPSLLKIEDRLKSVKIKAQKADFLSDWLTARSNVQLQDLAGQNRCAPKGLVEFIHIEFSESVRAIPKKATPAKFTQAIEAFEP
jgi:hypothetical protein